MTLLTQQTGHDGHQSSSCSELQDLLPLHVHLRPVVLQEGAQGQRLRGKRHTHLLHIFRKTVENGNDVLSAHRRPHHRSEGVYGLVNKYVVSRVVVDVPTDAEVDTGNPGGSSVPPFICFDVWMGLLRIE